MAEDRREQIEEMLQRAGLEDLKDTMRGLSDNIRNEVLDALNGEITATRKENALSRVRNHIDVTDAEIRDWTRQGTSEAYIAGLNEVHQQLDSFNIDINNKQVNLQTLRSAQGLTAHLEAANNLVQETYLNFAEGMSGLERTANRQLSEGLKRQLQKQFVSGRLQGEGIDVIRDRIVRDLGDEGFTALIDRGGRKWSLERYSEMLARTQLTKANNQAKINRYGDLGVDLVQISSHGATDALCAPEEGQVYSLSGESDKYPALTNPPPFHPNCRHQVLGRPALET